MCVAVVVLRTPRTTTCCSAGPLEGRTAFVVRKSLKKWEPFVKHYPNTEQTSGCSSEKKLDAD